jgi:exodeoxyribonuclease VIII
MPEVCYNQPDHSYRREPGLNQSSLKKILKSPAHYKSALEDKFIPSPAMEIGTALHCLVLDGQAAFDGQYIRKPDSIKLNTKEGKEWKAQQGKRKPLVEGGKDNPWGSIQGMRDSLARLDWYRDTGEDYIKRNEVSIYWDWEGQRCKARLDSVLEEEGIILDLKTTDNADPDAFLKKVISLGYDFQAAYYSKAAEVIFGKPFRFIFVAVERKPPYSVGLFEVDQDMAQEGLEQCMAALQLYKTCSSLNHWEDYDPTIKKLAYPRWHKKLSTKIVKPVEVLF